MGCPRKCLIFAISTSQHNCVVLRKMRHTLALSYLLIAQIILNNWDFSDIVLITKPKVRCLFIPKVFHRALSWRMFKYLLLHCLLFCEVLFLFFFFFFFNCTYSTWKFLGQGLNLATLQLQQHRMLNPLSHSKNSKLLFYITILLWKIEFV